MNTFPLVITSHLKLENEVIGNASTGQDIGKVKGKRKQIRRVKLHC